MRRQTGRWARRARRAGLVIVGLMILLEGGRIQAPTMPPIGTPTPHGIGNILGAQYRASGEPMLAHRDDHSN